VRRGLGVEIYVVLCTEPELVRLRHTGKDEQADSSVLTLAKEH